MFFIARATEPTLPGLLGRQRTTVNRERIAGSVTGSSYQSRYASIALPVPVRSLFTYSVPEGMEGSSSPGSRAVVPFGRRTLTGVIVSVSGTSDLDPSRVRAIASLPDAAAALTPPLMQTLLWAARYYVTAPGPLLAAALPPVKG